MPSKPGLVDHVHGVANSRCIHPDCQAAWAQYKVEYNEDRKRGIKRRVSARRARLHLSSYIARGWSFGAIAGETGVSLSTVSHVVQGKVDRISKDVSDRLLALDNQGLPTRTVPGRTEPFVLKVGAVRRIEALLVMGWTHDDMTRRCGASTKSVHDNGGQWILRSTHDKIAKMYRELSRRPGPSPFTRGQAIARGYLSPIFWDDIDNDVEPDWSHPDQDEVG